MEGLAAAGLGVALLTWWASASRRHVQRRARQAADWGAGAGARPDLWTSGARCPHCLRHGGLLELHGEDLWFVCLTCNQRHRRESRA